MQCKLCGFVFDEDEAREACVEACSSCDCGSVRCPNCGHSNVCEITSDFKFIELLKNKILKR